MFYDDPDRTLLLDLKEKISIAADLKIHKEEYKSLTNIEKSIDSLILCSKDVDYEEKKKIFRAELLESSYILEVSVNGYIRHSLLPLIDVLLVDEEDTWEK